MIVETRDLSKQYGSFAAVKKLNLRVPARGISGFLGPNGSGKTTTIKMLLGMVRPTSGEGRVLGRPIADPTSSLEIRRRVGFVSEDKRLYAYMTVAEVLGFTRAFFANWNRNRERELLNEFELPLDRKIRKLSKGMRTKLALVLALARGSELLILDEPSEGLDPLAAELMLQAVVRAASEGAAVFFSSHQISEVERIADHVFILHNGRLVLEGPLEQLRQSCRRVSFVFPGSVPDKELAIIGLDKVHVDGRTVSGLANGNAEQIVERAKRLDAISVDVQTVDLRELFLESLKGDPS